MQPEIIRNFNRDLPIEDSIAETASKLTSTEGGVSVADTATLLRYISR